MNIAYFLIPKNEVAYLYDDCTFRQGLEKMRNRGYTAIPVINREGCYMGTVSEGDFLWRILESGSGGSDAKFSMRDMERLQIRDILRADHPAVRITVTMEELIRSAMRQNFVPVVDDLDKFIGIVTRREIIRRLSEQKVPLSIPEKLRKIV